MKIYTKTGDKGTTGLFGGKRVSKASLQIECNGAIDELNAFIGFAKISVKSQVFRDLLTYIQKDLYTIMAVLSGSSKTPLLRVKQNIKLFEKTIDTLDNKLPDLRDFIIPQNNEPSTRLHIARTVCRRVERFLIRYYEEKRLSEKKVTLDSQKSPAILRQYFNRLSDLLFMMARAETDGEEIAKG
ncbi:MAG: cob(I)yrinic acid a,c-diamide adenosyltransferase [Candidatus Roizmanbacteria bacterium]|nr:cob(I)yrinic acid a,c-diamide adenosyltransferase [Candidatus Roizmanbacteria bacterium]